MCHEGHKSSVNCVGFGTVCDYKIIILLSSFFLSVVPLVFDSWAMCLTSKKKKKSSTSGLGKILQTQVLYEVARGFGDTWLTFEMITAFVCVLGVPVIIRVVRSDNGGRSQVRIDIAL